MKAAGASRNCVLVVIEQTERFATPDLLPALALTRIRADVVVASCRCYAIDLRRRDAGIGKFAGLCCCTNAAGTKGIWQPR